ncbi:MAG: helix-turn-helix transcriptional regulator [Roseovarius sp.]
MITARNDRLVSVRDTAAAYGCSVATVWRRVADGTIPKPVKIGGMTRWSASEISAHIEAAKASREAA